MKPTPFRIHVPQEVLDDLRARLEHTRLPDEVPDSEWEYGTSLAYMQELLAYWREEYDWRRHEAELNRFSQFSVPVNGIGVHFIQERGVGPAPLPLLLLHGWPGSIAEFTRLIPLLTDPARFGGDPRDAFTVIAPSLPGYTFSFKPGQARPGLAEIADMLAVLMTEKLGYPRFAAQGGDIGSFLAARMGYAHPEKLLGIHVTLLVVPYEPGPDAPAEEQAFAAARRQWMQEESGYQWIQGTRPQTLSYGLTDSPTGLAAWIVEKFRAWGDTGGNIESRFSKDALLTNIMLYWITGAINSSFWPYYDRRHQPPLIPPGERVRVPMGYADFPGEIVRTPRSIAQRVFDVHRWTTMSSGGHFAAMEEPEALASEIRAFFRELRQGVDERRT